MSSLFKNILLSGSALCAISLFVLPSNAFAGCGVGNPNGSGTDNTITTP